MSKLKYIGRVGALAVALGIGMAVATTPGFATAEPPPDPSSAADSAPSNASPASTDSTSKDDTKPALSVDGSSGAHTAANTPDVAQPATRSRRRTDSPATSGDEEPTGRRGTHRRRASHRSRIERVGTAAGFGESGTATATAAVARTEPSDNDSPAPAQPVTVDPPAAHTGLYEPSAGRRARSGRARDERRCSGRRAGTDVEHVVANGDGPCGRIGSDSRRCPRRCGSSGGAGLDPVGLGGFQFDADVASLAPVQSVGLWGLLAWVRREVQRTFFNQTPITSYNPVENSQTVDGVATGDLNAVDPDGDPLNFTVARAAERVGRDQSRRHLRLHPERSSGPLTGGTYAFTVKLEAPGPPLPWSVSASFTPGIVHSPTTRPPSRPPSGRQHRRRRPAAAGRESAPTATRVYVVNPLDDDISVIDTATNTVVTTITVGDSPYGVAMNPDAARAYVTNFADGNGVRDQHRYQHRTATITVGAGPNGVAVSADGTTRLRHQLRSTRVSVIDTATNTVLDHDHGRQRPEGWRQPRWRHASTSPTTSAVRSR